MGGRPSLARVLSVPLTVPNPHSRPPPVPRPRPARARAPERKHLAKGFQSPRQLCDEDAQIEGAGADVLLEFRRSSRWLALTFAPCPAGSSFFTIRADERTIYLKAGQNGVCAVKTLMAILVAFHDDRVLVGVSFDGGSVGWAEAVLRLAQIIARRSLLISCRSTARTVCECCGKAGRLPHKRWILNAGVRGDVLC
mgnify:CR=1 FL=1